MVACGLTPFMCALETHSCHICTILFDVIISVGFALLGGGGGGGLTLTLFMLHFFSGIGWFYVGSHTLVGGSSATSEC